MFLLLLEDFFMRKLCDKKWIMTWLRHGLGMNNPQCVVRRRRVTAQKQPGHWSLYIPAHHDLTEISHEWLLILFFMTISFCIIVLYVMLFLFFRWMRYIYRQHWQRQTFFSLMDVFIDRQETLQPTCLMGNSRLYFCQDLRDILMETYLE